MKHGIKPCPSCGGTLEVSCRKCSRRCQGDPDCEFPAELCVFHGGHDACAMDLMRAQAKPADLERCARAVLRQYHLDTGVDFSGEMHDAMSSLSSALRDLDAPCETCGGNGMFTEQYVHYDSCGYPHTSMRTGTCPTCGGGR